MSALSHPQPSANAGPHRTSAALIPSVGRVRRWSTPRLLVTMRLGLLLLFATLLAVVVQAIASSRRALHLVEHDTVPSIIAAQGIRTAIAGMDAELANELLGQPGSGLTALTNYDAERDNAAAALVAAAENITYGEAERGPIRTLQNGLAVYEELGQQVRDEHDAGQTAALDTFHQAETLVTRSLLPAATDLDAANSSVLEREDRRANTVSAWLRFLLLLLGLLTLFVLLAVQTFLSRRTRRLFNPMLVVATLLVIWVVGHAAFSIDAAQEQRRVARQSAFASLSGLWRARALAFEAEGEESHFLLEPLGAAGAQAAFTARQAALATLPAGLTADQLVTASRNGPPVEGFTGLLADPFSHLAFPGQRDAAVAVLAAFEQYVALDAKVRALEREGQHGPAVELSAGTNSGQAAGALRAFDHTLDAAIAIDQQAFAAAIASSGAALRGVDVETFVVLGAAAVLVFLGISARLREYA